MRKRIYDVLNKIYGILMTVSFFGGFLPVIPFVVAILVGGETGEAIAVFLYQQYYPWVILVGSVAVLIGLAAMYVGKIDSLSIKNSARKKENK